jgi:hypothetical protein
VFGGIRRDTEEFIDNRKAIHTYPAPLRLFPDAVGADRGHDAKYES